MAVRQVIGRGALALPRGLGGLRRRRRAIGQRFADFTVDDVGALAEFLQFLSWLISWTLLFSQETAITLDRPVAIQSKT